jgi:hypothetical protein
VGEGHVVERQDLAPEVPRAVDDGGRRDRRNAAGPGAVARGVRTGKAVQNRNDAAADGGRRRGRHHGAGRDADGRRPHQQVGRHQRTAGRAHRRGLPVEARHRAPQGREAGARGQGRRPPGRVPVQRLPGLRPRLGGAQDRQHDRRLPRHDADHVEVQPVHLQAVRLRARAGGGHGAVPRRQDGREEVAHRLRRLRVGPGNQGRLRRADQEGGRRGGQHHRHPARDRRHDAVPLEDQRQLRRPLRDLLRQGRRDHRQPGVRPGPHQEVQVGG